MHELLRNGWYARGFSVLWLLNLAYLVVRMLRARGGRGGPRARALGEVVQASARPVVRFATADGTWHQFAMASSTPLAVGERVEVDYRSADPYDAVVAGTPRSSGIGAAVAMLSLFLVFGLVMAWFSWAPLLGLPAPDPSRLLAGWALGWTLIGIFGGVGVILLAAMYSAARDNFKQRWWMLILPGIVVVGAMLAAIVLALVQARLHG